MKPRYNFWLESDGEVAAELLGVPYHRAAAAAAELLGSEEQGVDLIAVQSHEAQRCINLVAQDPKLGVRGQVVAHLRLETQDVILADKRVRRPHGSQPDIEHRLPIGSGRAANVRARR